MYGKLVHNVNLSSPNWANILMLAHFSQRKPPHVLFLFLNDKDTRALPQLANIIRMAFLSFEIMAWKKKLSNSVYSDVTKLLFYIS